jgi:hypothetical protein
MQRQGRLWGLVGTTGLFGDARRKIETCYSGRIDGIALCIRREVSSFQLLTELQ